MLIFYKNPVVNAKCLTDEDLIKNFDESRNLHREIQDKSGKTIEHKFWAESICYLMLFGDCHAREIQRRGLDYETNLVLQHPQMPFPPYWNSIDVLDVTELINIIDTEPYPFQWEEYPVDPEPDPEPVLAEDNSDLAEVIPDA